MAPSWIPSLQWLARLTLTYMYRLRYMCMYRFSLFVPASAIPNGTFRPILFTKSGICISAPVKLCHMSRGRSRNKRRGPNVCAIRKLWAQQSSYSKYHDGEVASSCIATLSMTLWPLNSSLHIYSNTNRLTLAKIIFVFHNVMFIFRTSNWVQFLQPYM